VSRFTPYKVMPARREREGRAHPGENGLGCRTVMRPMRPGRYLDSVSLANLIVSIATLAWTI
jgi:hypothetical protein